MVTSTIPYGTREAFLIPELLQLADLTDVLLIIPMRPGPVIVHEDARALAPHTLREGLLSWRIIHDAARQIARRPRGAVRSLGLLLADLRPRILAKNLAVYAKGLWLAQVIRDARIEHVHAHWAATTASLAMFGATVAEVPWSFTAHRWDIEERNLLRSKSQRACFVRAISQVGARSVARYLTNGTAGAEVIHVGVPLPPKAAIARGDPSRGCRLLVPANLVPVKGHRYLLEAVRVLTSRGVRMEVDLAGDGPLRTDLERQAAALQLTDQVHFCGALPHHRLIDGLSQHEWDLVVLPSIVTPGGEHEGIPVSLMEAMAHGIPVIGTTTGGIPELVVEGTGLLVPPEDPLQLADAIAVLATDPDARALYGAAGRARVEEAFAVDATVASLLGCIAARGTRMP